MSHVTHLHDNQAVTKAPRLMLAKMESEEMELTSDQIKARDVETQKAQHEVVFLCFFFFSGVGLVSRMNEV